MLRLIRFLIRLLKVGCLSHDRLLATICLVFVEEFSNTTTRRPAAVSVELRVEIAFVEVSHQGRCHRIDQALLLQLRLNVELYAVLEEIDVLMWQECECVV